MARSTRQQRRRRRQRQETTPAEQQGVTQRARARQQQVRPAQQPPKTQTGRRGGGGGGRRFISESAAELRKVEWPNQRQVLTGTVVVIIACAIVGTYLWLADLALQPFVQRLLLGQQRSGVRDVSLVRDQHLFRAREQGQGQSRAPDRLDEPAAPFPAC